MEYFVSFNQKAYYDWQIELLIESFKNHNLQDKLSVAGANTGENRYKFLSNIANHENFLNHHSIGLKRGFQQLDEIYSLAYYQESKKLGTEICVMQPHVVLKNPKYLDEIKTNQSSAIVSIDPFFTFEHAEKNAGDFWAKQAHGREFYKTNWLPLGSIILFNNLSEQISTRATIVAEQIILNQIQQKIPVWNESVKLAWAISIADYLGLIKIEASYNLVSNMIDDGSTPFIDYKDGVPPVFNKSMFSFAPPFEMSFGDPIEVLATCKMSPNADYMSQISESLLKSRAKSEQTP